MPRGKSFRARCTRPGRTHRLSRFAVISFPSNQGSNAEVSSKLTDSRCTCASRYLFPSFTRTTWPFAFYASVIAAHVAAYMLLFIRAGLQLRSELRASSATPSPDQVTTARSSRPARSESPWSLTSLRPSSLTLAQGQTPPPGTPGSGISKEAASVQQFYRYLTAVFVVISIVFAAYCFYPEVSSHRGTERRGWQSCKA